ncbi:hypothetical protein Csa_000226 [Cucumis sativus]|uniref:Uncharacterized protein n=1 Tax=Cucumis sativus TaxID=3659 RepID=A0A0A0KKE5_CUCSA|nr:hypothetical protein Csa_000226 [Cucumis sativus]
MVGWLDGSGVAENVGAVAGELPEPHMVDSTFHVIPHDHNRYRVRPRAYGRLRSDFV